VAVGAAVGTALGAVVGIAVGVDTAASAAGGPPNLPIPLAGPYGYVVPPFTNWLHIDSQIG